MWLLLLQALPCAGLLWSKGGEKREGLQKNGLPQVTMWSRYATTLQELHDIVKQCLQKDPALRPTTSQLLKHKFFKVPSRPLPDLCKG